MHFMAWERTESAITESFKTYKEVSKFSLTGWVKTVLRKAGIGTSQFKTHSCRSAAISKAKAMDISLEGVLTRGQSSVESTWQKHYHKAIQRNETFETAVLINTKLL